MFGTNPMAEFQTKQNDGANVPVKSKLKHPPGQSPGRLNFWKIFGKFSPPEAEKLFKCPFISPF